MDIKKLADEWFAKMGIQKAPDGIIDLDNTNFGQIMPIPVVEQMISISRRQNAWLGMINGITRRKQIGYVPIIGVNGNVTEGIGPNDPTPVTKRPTTDRAEYSCRKYKSEYYIPTETIMEYAATPEMGNFEARLAEEFAIAMGNDMANIIINSDTSLDSSTSLNRMLRMVNGVQKQMALANVLDAEGKAWGQGIWTAMQGFLPEKYRTDPNLQWMFHDNVNLLWHNSLTNVNTTQRMRSSLGDQAISTEVMVPPNGKRQNIVNQISPNQGVTPIAPTAVADDSDGTMTIRVHTILPDTTDHTGRRVKVVFKANSMSEICTVSYNGSNQNVIETVGALGQVAISTTPGDYTVTQYDETNILYGNPKGITQVIWNQWRSYREFNKNADRHEITTYWHGDILVPVPAVFVNFKRVTTKLPTDW